MSDGGSDRLAALQNSYDLAWRMLDAATAEKDAAVERAVRAEAARDKAVTELATQLSAESRRLIDAVVAVARTGRVDGGDDDAATSTDLLARALSLAERLTAAALANVEQHGGATRTLHADVDAASGGGSQLKSDNAGAAAATSSSSESENGDDDDEDEDEDEDDDESESEDSSDNDKSSEKKKKAPSKKPGAKAKKASPKAKAKKSAPKATKKVAPKPKSKTKKDAKKK